MDGKLRCMTSTYLLLGDQVLMLYRVGSRVLKEPSWCGVGGHFETEELNDARACALRELHEETGLTADDLEGLTLRYITLRLKNGEVRQNYYFFAQLLPGCEPVHDGSEGQLAWQSIDEVLRLPMPFTAGHVLRHYFAEGRVTNVLYGGISTEDGTVFTPLREF